MAASRTSGPKRSAAPSASATGNSRRGCVPLQHRARCPRRSPSVQLLCEKRRNGPFRQPHMVPDCLCSLPKVPYTLSPKHRCADFCGIEPLLIFFASSRQIRVFSHAAPCLSAILLRLVQVLRTPRIRITVIRWLADAGIRCHFACYLPARATYIDAIPGKMALHIVVRNKDRLPESLPHGSEHSCMSGRDRVERRTARPEQISCD